MDVELRIVTSLQYIAGFFDGEGYIQIAKRSPGCGTSGSPYYLVCSMANTHRQVMDEIQKIVGGRVIFHRGGKKQWKPHYRLTLWTQQALAFLKAVQPYLIVKREEADLAISFYECIKPYGSRVKLTDDDMAVRVDCYNKMKSLKGNRGANHVLG